ncbi:MAG: hypothetical protein WCP21_16175, partial [Armatimonadota bacterium]
MLAILAISQAHGLPSPNPNGGGNPSWSPDGRKVVLSSATPNSPVDLWVVDLQSNHYRQITNLGGRRLGWSPDSKTLYYQTFSGGHLSIFAAVPAGGPDQPVFTFLGDDAVAVAPAPDGKSAAYVRRTDQARDLWVADCSGANQRRLAQNMLIRSVAWSRDSQRLAFDVGGIIGEATYVVAISGGEPKPAFEDMGNWPSWSPDGNLLAVLGMHAMTVFKADGSGSRRLHVSQADRGPVSWSRDGKLIAYTCVEKNRFGIATVTPGTGKSVTLSSGWAEAASPRWSPDGHALIFDGRRPGAALSNVYIMDVKTRLYRPLTTASVSQWSPLPSGDGKATFFLSNGVRVGFISLCRATSGGTVGLMPIEARYPLQFSWPRQAFNGLLVNGQTIWLLFSSAAPRVLLKTEHPTSADLAPEGDRLVYVKWHEHRSSLVIRQLSNGSEQELLPPPASGLAYSKVSWSPGGDTIAFVCGNAVCKIGL